MSVNRDTLMRTPILTIRGTQGGKDGKKEGKKNKGCEMRIPNRLKEGHWGKKTLAEQPRGKRLARAEEKKECLTLKHQYQEKKESGEQKPSKSKGQKGGNRPGRWPRTASTKGGKSAKERRREEMAGGVAGPFFREVEKRGGGG